MDKVIIDRVDVSGCEHYRAEIETKMPYGEYEIQKDKCHYSGIEIIQNCKGNKGCIYKQLQRVKAELKKYEDQRDKSDQCLKEIKEICTRIINYQDGRLITSVFDEIIDKINECIGVE